jgi:serine/threonine protein kinase
MSLAGTRIGIYEVLSLLGSGGMGEVYRARDTKLGREVAIKILPPAVAADPDRLARFEREARLLASLNQPNIGAIYGVEESGGVTALVLELVEGETLADRIARESRGSKPESLPGLSVADSLAIARQIADALDAAHERGIVHRDLKPANIVITPDGTVKVLDFGLAKAGESGGSGGTELTNSPTMIAPTLDGVLLGTAPYMSPEQARGKAVDKRTDIWAFGCVLYEMLTGRRAFHGETISDTIVSILEREPDWHTLPAGTPAQVRRLARRCLEKDPKRRLRDIGDVKIELDDRADSVAPLEPVPARQNRERIVWIAAVALLALVLALAVRRSGGPPTGTPSVSRLVRLTSGPALEFAPAISPDGKWVAYLSDARGVTDVWVKFVAGGEPINLTASTNLELQSRVDIGGLAISPDGTSIAFTAGPRGIGNVAGFATWAIPAPLGGVPRKLLEIGRALRWSPDGSKILYVAAGGSAGDALWIADADGSNAHEIAPRRGGMHKHWPAWSHDSRYVYFNYSITTANVEPTDIYRVPVSGGPIESMVSSTRRAVSPVLARDGTGFIYAANPQTAELALWWKSLDRPEATPIRLTTGLGEYNEPDLSADGRSLVSTFVDARQTLITLPAVADVHPNQIGTLTSGYTGDLDPALSPQGDRLVFSSTRGGNRNLWIARPDGGEPRPLTSSAAIDERPVFSPDGRQIAFVSDRGGDRGIWLINADGGAARSLVKAQVLDNLSWSRDGRRIVYAAPGDASPGLWLVTVADGSVASLHTPGPAAAPAWSPASDVIAYAEALPSGPGTPAITRAKFVDPNGQSLALAVPDTANIGNGTFAWDPSGKFLAALGNSGALASVIWIVEPGASGPARKVMSFPFDATLRGLTWSHDATSLIVGEQNRTSDIVWMDLRRR